MELSQLNADLSQRVVINSEALEWAASPSPGVWRRMLERAGAESGRATSIVCYDSGASFPSHFHPAGEEFLVLEGVFSDEAGDYPAATYVLNPAGSSHAPRTRDGCILFVKLCQYEGANRPRRVVDTRAMTWEPGPAPGIQLKPLYAQDGYPERMMLMKWEAGARMEHHAHPGGEEILVLKGTLADESGAYPHGTWIRNPPGSSHSPHSPDGCVIFIKLGGVYSGEPAASGSPKT